MRFVFHGLTRQDLRRFAFSWLKAIKSYPFQNCRDRLGIVIE